MIAPGAAVVSHNAEEFIFLALGFMCSGSLFQAANFGDRPEHYSVLTLIKAIDKPEHCPWRIAKERSTLTLEHTRQAGQAISRQRARSHRLQTINAELRGRSIKQAQKSFCLCGKKEQIRHWGVRVG